MKFLKVFTILIFTLILSIPASYAYENVVDDFDDGADPSFWGGGVYPQNIINSYDSDIQRTPNPGYSRKIYWNINPGDWAGFIINGLNNDVSGYNYFSFWIYTPNPGTDIKVELEDIDEPADRGRVLLKDYLVTGTSVWQHVCIPIEAFQRDNASLDLNKLEEIKWTSDYNDGNDSSGTIYLDDISFLVQSHTPADYKLFSGGDRGVQGVCDEYGDTVVIWDQVSSSQTVNITTVTVSSAYSAVWVSTPNDVNAVEGNTYYIPYQIKNGGNSADSIVLSTSTLSGESWPASIYWDKDKSGTHTAGDMEYYNTIGLLPESTHYFLVKVDVPFGAVGASSSTIKITAKTNNGSGTDDGWPAAGDDTIEDDFTVVVDTVYAVNILTAPSDQNLTPGNTAYYAYCIKNNGNISDTYALSVATISDSAPWTIKITSDTNQNGSYDNGENNVISASGSLAPGTSFYFIVMVLIPEDATTDSATVRLTVTGNGASDTDDTVTSTNLDTTPPVIEVLTEPPSKIGMIGNKLVFKAKITDNESAISAVKLFYTFGDNPKAYKTVTTKENNEYETSLKDEITASGTLVYYWYALNGDGYIKTESSKTVTINLVTSSPGFTNGTVSVEDGNPNDGQTSVTVSEGALIDKINLTITQNTRTSVMQAEEPASTPLPSTVYTFGPADTMFRKPVEMTLLYLDTDDDGDEDTSGKNEGTMRAYWFDGYEWRLLGGVVNTELNTVTIKTMHFSKYAVFPTNALTADDYRAKERIITPLGSPGKNDFAQFGVSGDFKINIYDVNGMKVRTLDDNINIWSGEDDNGDVVESGVYIYQIKIDGKVISGTILVAK